MNNEFTDEQRVDIAKQEYNSYNESDPVKIGRNKETIGRVSQVNDKPTGEQSFVVTDKYCPPTASIEERNQVKEVTVIYRGSSFDVSSDAAKDWFLNDIPTGIQVINNGGAVATPQLQSSAETLRNAMKAYPNAEFNIYGHSLGAMNAQYAVADLSQKDSLRVSGGFFYEGPNIYSILTLEQKTTADALTKLNKLFNYVDFKDIIAIGYGSDKLAIGNVIRVQSKKVGVIDQHMWGGYEFNKDGTIKATKEGSLQLAKYMVSQQLSGIDRMRKNFMKNGDGNLSSSQEIFLDASEAIAITQGMKQTINGEITDLKKMYQKAITNAQELWKTTKSNAENTGSHLSYGECLNALARGNATESSIVSKPVCEYEEKLSKVIKISQNYDELLQQINESINKQLETDQKLAQEIRSM